MNIQSFRNHSKLPLAASVLLLAVGAVQAGTVPPSVRDAAQPPPPREQAQREQGPREQGPSRGQAAQNPGPSRQQGAPRGNDRPGNAGRGNGNGGGSAWRNDGRNDARGNDRRRVDRGYNRPPSGNWSTSDGRRNFRPNPPRRYVPALPSGHARYDWRGRQYYYQGGHWYRPYGAQFAIVRAPFGLFVNTLPSYYSSVWYGGSRYFHADDTYYLYEPARRGYVVTRSPYDDDQSEDYEEADDELFIYPARGQSEQQQADDKYECHRWAADQTDYDPMDSDYDAAELEEYQRAMTACLTGRGYSVR